MTLPPDPDETPVTPASFIDGCARSGLWLGASLVYILTLGWTARRFSTRPGGIVSLGLAVLLFVWAAARPPFVSGLRFHPQFARFGRWQKSDYIGEAYLILMGLVLVGFGLYELLA
jgi:hypothetical protein